MPRPRKPWQPKLPPQTRPVQRVVGYCRVSTGDQAESGYGLEAQQNAIRAYCEAAGYDLTAIFADEGLSGTLGPEQRPGLAAALAAAQNGEIDALVTKALDRIGRRPAVATAVFELLDAAGVQFISISEPYLNSELLRGLFAGIAADERRRILERTRAGRTTKAAAGGYAGGRPPFGYRLIGARRQAHLAVEPAEAEVVRRIFAERAAGRTYAAIAATLNAERIASSAGASWSPSRVYAITTNPVYTGVRRWREGTEIAVPAASQEAIIDEATFRRLQPAGTAA